MQVQAKRGGWMRTVVSAVAAMALGGGLGGAASAGPVKVLMVTGDWKTQPWYQDVWMKGRGEKLFRGRYIAQKVNQAAPGACEFTELTNYVGQEYLDTDYLSQFDVLLMGDVVGWSFNPRFQAAIGDFVKQGGGLIYCASWKWHCAMVKGTPFADALPAEFPISNLTDDWHNQEFSTGEKDIKPVLAEASHAVTQGLDWASAPPLLRCFKVAPRPGTTVLLKTPGGAPLLVAGDLGKGRTIMSAAIFANDEISEKLGSEWKDFGKYYAQLFAWLGANSTNKRATLADARGEATVTVDAGKPLNPVPAAMFSIHGAQDCPGFNPLQGEALARFNDLNPRGEFARFHANCEPARGTFDFKDVDHQLSEIKRLGMEPLALFAAYAYGMPKWLWDDGSSWDKPSERAVRDIVTEIDSFLAHVNGKKGDPAYRENVKYVEVCNEPGIDTRTIDGYVRIYQAVARHVHQNYPGVKVGGLGGYEIPYVKMFIDRCGADIDWISRHPYGWTGEMLFKLQDEFQAYAKAKGHAQIKFIVTEWDFWIQGRAKFDYMMKRYFEAVKRDDLLGTLHYRFGMYNEPVYLFGVLWAGWGQAQGAGPVNTPMHDAYDAFWIFRDFRGQRVQTTKQLAAGVSAGLAAHLLADATRDGDRVNAVLYYDWAYDGTGYKDYVAGKAYPTVGVAVKLTVPPCAVDRDLVIATATGEGFKELKRQATAVRAGQTDISVSLDVQPLTAVSLTLAPAR